MISNKTAEVHCPFAKEQHDNRAKFIGSLSADEMKTFLADEARDDARTQEALEYAAEYHGCPQIPWQPLRGIETTVNDDGDAFINLDNHAGLTAFKVIDDGADNVCRILTLFGSLAYSCDDMTDDYEGSVIILGRSRIKPNEWNDTYIEQLTGTIEIHGTPISGFESIADITEEIILRNLDRCRDTNPKTESDDMVNLSDSFNGTPRFNDADFDKSETYTLPTRKTATENRGRKSLKMPPKAGLLTFPQILAIAGIQPPESETGFTTFGSPVISDDFVTKPLKEPLVQGIVRQAETLNVIAASKTGKTWMVMGLAACLVRGDNWLSTYPCKKSRVHVIDNELHKPTFDKRWKDVCRAYDMTAEESRQLTRQCIRGKNATIVDIVADLILNHKKGDFDVIFIDAMYRTLPRGTSENDSADMTAFYNLLDSLAEHLDCTVAIVHHSSKGNQGFKSVTDVGSGAGAISRATDAHLVIRDHKEKDYAVLDAKARSFPPIESQTVYFDFPRWLPSDLEPAVAANRKDGQDAEKDVKDTMAIVEKMSQTIPFNPRAVTSRTGISENRATKLLEASVGRLFKFVGEEENRVGNLKPLYVVMSAAESKPSDEPSADEQGEFSGDDFTGDGIPF
ncbi:MAG: AAA family ATPase [Proteobacteria bacterium]|nr:AAA family ATPase [Pseudomonadota bacterium]